MLKKTDVVFSATYNANQSYGIEAKNISENYIDKQYLDLKPQNTSTIFGSKINGLARVYEPLVLNFFMILTKLGKQETNDLAALSSSRANIARKPRLAGNTRSPLTLVLRLTSH